MLKDCENVNQYSRKNENCHILRIIAFHGFGKFLLHSGTGQDAYTFLPLLKKRPDSIGGDFWKAHPPRRVFLCRDRYNSQNGHVYIQDIHNIHE